MARCLAWAGLLLLLLAQLGSSANSAKDQKVLDQAATTKDKYCSKMESIKSVTYEEGRKILEFGMGTDNPLYKILLSSKDPDDLKDRAQEEIGAGFVISTGWPIVLSILVFVAFYGFFFWTSCCKCCRCCVRYRKPTMLKKGIFAAALLLALICWAVCLLVANAGYVKISDGSITAGCSAAKLIEDTMAGSAENTSTTAARNISVASASFVGIIPMVDTFNKLVQQLDDNNSPLLSGLTSLLDETSKIDEAVAFAEATIALIEKAMDNANNVEPKDPLDGSKSLYHKCELCAAMVDPMKRVRQELRTGVANALKSTRGEVQTQLDPNDPDGQIKKLSKNVRDAIDPLNKVKDEVRDIVGWFVEPNGFQEYADHTYGSGSTLSLIVLYAFLPSALIILCGCSGLGLWQFQEKYKPNPETDANGVPRNPYLVRGPGVVCCSWCNSCIFAINVLFIGGIMVAVSVPVSGACLALTEINYTNGKNLLTSVGAIKDGKIDDNMQVVLTVIDRCLSLGQEEFHKKNGTSLNLMDMVTLNNGSTTQTVRERVIESAVQPINDQFAQLDDRLKSSPIKLSDQADLLRLRRIFSKTPVSAAYRVDPYVIKNDPDYGDMWNTPAAILWASSLSCSNHTPNITDLKIDLRGYKEVPGIIWAWDQFSTLKFKVSVPTVAPASAGRLLQAGPIPAIPTVAPAYEIEVEMGEPAPGGTCTAGTLRMLSCNNYSQLPERAKTIDLAGQIIGLKDVKAGCDAGSRYMQNVKRKLQKDKVFRCMNPMKTGTSGKERCHPELAARDPGTGRWTNTCLEREKTWDGKVLGHWKNTFDTDESSCTLDEWNEYVQKFDILLKLAFSLLDTAVQDTLNDVRVNMRSVVDANVLDPMYDVINQCNCNFMLSGWKGLLNGLCYSGTGGYIDLAYSYVILATGMLFLGIAFYIFWRIMRDNRESFMKESLQSNTI